MDSMRILVVAADPLARAGLGMLLEQQGLTALALLPATDSLEDTLSVYRPDVLIWDLGWDPSDEALDQLDSILSGPEERPGSPLPALVLIPETGLTGRVWGAGAQGILLRDTSGAQLAAALTAVKAGLATFEQGLVSNLASAAALGHEQAAEPLTPREAEVLQLVAEGMANKAIAHRLGISEHTVKFHVNAIMTKLGAQSRTEAVVRATRLGLISL